MASSSASKSLPAASTIGRVREIHEIERFLDRFPSGLPAWSYPASRGSARLSCGVRGGPSAGPTGLLTLVARQREVDATTQLGGLADLLGEGVPERSCAHLPALQRTAIDIALLRAAPADPR